MDDLATAFKLKAIAQNAADPATNTIVMAAPKKKPCRKFPFLKLPPEIRCFIYEQAFLNIVEGAEAVDFVREW